MKPLKFISLLLFFLFAFTQSYSQDYKTGIGVRLQPYFGCLTVKHFFNTKFALEGLLNVKKDQAVVEIIPELSNSFAKPPGLNWYFGIGGNIKFPQNQNVIIGVVGMLGLEYTFPNAPINLSLDWKPSLELIGGNSSYPAGFGLSVRYVFKAEKEIIPKEE